MQQPVSRRVFLAAGPGTCAALTLGGVLVSAESGAAQTKPKAKGKARRTDAKPRLDLTMVQEFVVAGHGNLERVQALLKEEPALINASWDWGGGDWETALGGAAHTGRRNVALYLLEKGARIDLFAATMLGNLEIVKAAVAAVPAVHKVRGPHGITLVAHAKAGGDEAGEVLKYLESLKD